MPSKPNPATEVAISAFAEVLKAERVLDRKLQELSSAIVRVPEVDRPFYLFETEEMRRIDAEIRGRTQLPTQR